MAFMTRRTVYLLVGLVLGFIAAVAGLIWSGVYNIGADDPHTRPIYAVLEVARERSIERRAAAIEVPDLIDPARAIQGAGNYDAMCTGCHLTPGAPPTELSRGLYPVPPNLSLVTVDPAKAFWVIKHGIKASGMPAWGESMDDAYIWNMVAFLQKLPGLDAAGYREMVGQSGGHSHGGGESDGHSQAEVPEGNAPETSHHTDAHSQEPAEASVHEHADGSLHDHGSSPTVTDPEPAPAVSDSAAPAEVPEPTESPASVPAATPAATAEAATPEPAEHDEHTDHHH